MKILVTGGAGFVGSNLIKKLLDLENEVVCLDDLSTGIDRNVKLFSQHKKYKFVKQDIALPLPEDLGIFDEIYNLACPASPPRYQKDPIQTIKSSVLGSFNVLELARKNQAKILQASTSEVYGNPKIHPQKENYWGNVNPVGLRSCYDEGKRCAETIFFDYARKYSLPVKIVRIFNTYGPNMDPKDGRVISNFIIQALKNEPLTIYGDGSQTRSFQYIDDLVEGMLKMMEGEKNFPGPVNLGNPDEFSINELSQIIRKLIPESKSEIIHKPLPEDDPERRKPDITLAKEKLGWEPKVKLEEGLIKTIEYFRKVIEKV